MAAAVLLVCTAVCGWAQNTASDDGSRVLGLEQAWNHAIEAKDTKALEMLLANTFVAVESDGSVSSKSEFLASIKAREYFFFQAEDGIRDLTVTGVQTCALPI